MSNCVHVGEVELLVKPREGFPDLMSGKREILLPGGMMKSLADFTRSIDSI